MSPRRSRQSGLVALLTDFGMEDPYVGVMKGVILSIHPACRLVDITHLIPPGDIREGAYALRSARPHFPPGTVFLCVVDPGVGSSRRAIVAEAGGHLFVAPDNGLLTLVRPFRRCVRIEKADLFRKPVSRTFHGRDIFAPVAAHLARGMPLARIGSPVHRPVRLPLPSPVRKDREVRGEVTRVDRFGNLITNLGSSDLPGKAGLVIRVGRRRIRGLCRTYADGVAGRPAAIIGSDGYLEVVIPGGSASNSLRIGIGARVVALAGGRGGRRAPGERG